MDQGVHPTKLKRLGGTKANVLDEYLEAGDPFEGHPYRMSYRRPTFVGTFPWYLIFSLPGRIS
jgi:hypothetical protein